MKTILIANPKGVCRKTTLSVNIAGFLANRGHRVALLDMDRQQSAALWVATRPEDLPPVRALKYNIVQDSPFNWLVADSAAGLAGGNLPGRPGEKGAKVSRPHTPAPS